MFAGRSSAMRSALTLGVGIALGVAATVAVLEHQTTGPQGSSRPEVNGDMRSGWAEIKWPFAVDPWSVNKALRCSPAVCGGELTLYLRAKIGFCNCATGVADDEELERLADLHLLGGTHSADGPGRPIAIAWMKGRSRSYSVAGTSPDGRSALTIAFNDRCDAIVATVLVGHDRPAAAEQAVVDFLNGDVVLKWAQVTLGL